VNPIYCRPKELRIKPTTWKSGNNAPDVFNISLWYSVPGCLSDYFSVHIPKGLQPAMHSGQVIGFHLETLEFQGVSSKALPGAPKYAVLQVSLADGTDIELIPEVLQAERNSRRIWGTAACLIGIALLYSPYFCIGALVLVTGTHALRTARHIPHLPLLVTAAHGELPDILNLK